MFLYIALESGATYQASTTFQLSSLVPVDTFNFFRYSGSLTTSPFPEIVTWHVFEKTIKISQSQVSSL